MNKRRVETPALTISLLSFNNKALLEKCLNSIFRHQDEVNLKVLLVDNASVDGSADMVHRKFPQVSLTRNQTNAYFIKAHNQNLQKVKTKYFLVLNEDIEIPKGTLKVLLKFMEENPRVGLVSCRLIDGEGKTDTTCSRFPHPLDELFGYSFLGKLLRRVVPLPWVEKRLRNYHYAGWQRDTIREVEVIPGSFFLGRKKLLEDVGLFDERFLMFYEEPDYGIRARTAGWQTVHIGTVHARHLRAQGLIKLTPLTRYRLGEHDLLAYYLKHFGILWWLILRVALIPNWLYWHVQAAVGK